MPLFPVPVGVANRIEYFQRDFLWDGVGEKCKFHLVRPKICTPVYSRGLGVRTLLAFNHCFVGQMSMALMVIGGGS